MSVEVIDKIKPKNGGNFKIVDSIDVEMSDGKSLQETVSNLSDKVEDISNGKFEGSEKYYTMAEVIAKYYNREEIDLLIEALESEIGDFTTEADIKSLIASYYPIKLSQIDHDFDIYVKKAELKDQLDDILIDYQPGDSVEDLEEALRNYYTKEEVYTKTETNTKIAEAITPDKISNAISSNFYNKQEITDFLVTKADSSISNTIGDIGNTLDLYINSNNEALTNLESRMNTSIAESVGTKANQSALEELKVNFEGHVDTFTETVSNLCSPDRVKGIITTELEDGKSLNNAIKQTVLANYQTLSERIETIDTKQDKYATLVFVNEELTKLKFSIDALKTGDTSDLTDLLDNYLINLNNRVEEIINNCNNYTDELIYGADKETDGESIHVIGVNERLDDIENIIGDTSELKNNISNLIKEINQNINDLQSFRDSVLGNEEKNITGEIPTIKNKLDTLETDIDTNKNNISLINEVIGEGAFPNPDELESSFKTLDQRISEIELTGSISGVNTLRHDVDQLKENFNTLIAVPVINEETREETFVNGSVYDKIFNHPSMNYKVELGGDEIVLKQFTAEDFLAKIETNSSNINSLSTRLNEVSGNITGTGGINERLTKAEGSVYTQNAAIASMQEKVSVIDKYDEHLTSLDTLTKNLQDQLNEVDKVTASSIITKINNSEENVKITSNNLDLRGAVGYNSLSGDITSLFVKNNNGVFINGRMIGSKTISVNTIDFKGMSVTSYEKIDNTTKTSYESFSISDLGKVSIINPTIISTNFKAAASTGYELLPDGKAYFNNAEIKGKFIMPNSGIDGLSSLNINSENEVRFWAGETEENKAKAPFRVHQSGFLFASNASIGGSIASNEFHNGSVHMLADEIKINNKFMYLDNEEDKIQSVLAGTEEKDFVVINSRQIKLNSNLEVSDSLRCISPLKALEINSKMDIVNDDTEIKIDNNGIKLFTDNEIKDENNNIIETVKARHSLYQDKNTGSLVFESNNKSDLASPDFKFASRNSKRDCNMYVQGNLTVTEEIKSNKNNVVMRSTENGFAFFAL